MLQAARNALVAAEATRALGGLCVARGSGEEAERVFEDALARFEQFGRSKRAVDDRERLGGLRS